MSEISNFKSAILLFCPLSHPPRRTTRNSVPYAALHCHFQAIFPNGTIRPRLASDPKTDSTISRQHRGLEMRITLKNYRCFPDSRPATFDMREGFTAFVGINNSGKSSLLKFFHEFRELFGAISSFSENFIQALGGGPRAFPLTSVSDTSEVFCNSNNRDLSILFDFSPSELSPSAIPLPVPTKIAITVPNKTNTFKAQIATSGGPVNYQQFRAAGETLREKSNTNKGLDFAPLFEILRNLKQTLYIGPFRNAINVGASEDYFDIKVGQSFISQWRSLKTGNVKRNNELILNLTEDIRRIFDFENLQIDASEDGRTLQVFVNQKSYKLNEIGSGLAQFIIVFGNAAILQPKYTLIDEPELNLHPSLMLDFLTTLGSYSKNGVLFCTHSMGLARGAADRIYSLRKIGEGDTHLTEYEGTPRLSEFLGELSFSGYQELGGQKILLVEGRTDVKTMQQFLRLFKMDHKIVLLPLGGSALINPSAAEQLAEIKRISQDISALIDSERSVAGAALSTERAGFVSACQSAGIDCHVLALRAIENYFPNRAVKHALGNSHIALQPFQLLKDVSPSWGKSDNWRIAREMTKEDLNGTDLGAFLLELCSVAPEVQPAEGNSAVA
ncbi:MAG TPA: hypothetical protein VGZ48_05135 [Candidatus Acidoferrales bacterium]|nr:hypothetical protein [Candidatus Acidoferrales bacterium]